MLQKQLKSSGLSTGGATFSRFVFAVPLAMALAAALVAQTGTGWPRTGALFWLFAAGGGLAQIVATMATVALFAERNFAVGVAFTKSETVMVALFSALVLGELVSLPALAAIALGVSGVLLLSITPAGRWTVLNRATGLGLLAGAGFALSAIGYRGATLQLEGTALLRAAITLAAVTLLQTIGMALWLHLREPGTLPRVARAWRRTVLVGVTGMLGSLGWITAFALQNAAYVRTVGQLEMVFSFIAGVLFFHERANARELWGIALLTGSVIGIVLLT